MTLLGMHQSDGNGSDGSWIRVESSVFLGGEFCTESSTVRKTILGVYPKVK